MELIWKPEKEFDGLEDWTPEDRAILRKLPWSTQAIYQNSDINDFWDMKDYIQWGRIPLRTPDE